MRIGIDISQLAYPGTGVANYIYQLVDHLLQVDSENEYILFYSSLRVPIQNSEFKNQNYKAKFKIKTMKIPPFVLDILWNKLHIVPIEQLIGDLDVFITSDWTEPPARHAKKATIIYDMIVYKYPEETDKKIIRTQKRKLKWVKKESGAVLTISESSKKDIVEILKIPKDKIYVIYPGI